MNSQPQTVPADHPLGQRLLRAPLYPLQGAALVALVTLALAHAVTDLLPGVLGLGGGIIIWASIIQYAMECLRRTANGYAEPPEVTLYSHYGPALSMLMLQMLGFIALILALKLVPALWLPLLLLVLVLPAAAMSLAFEDHLLAALNPLRWGIAIATFGASYLLPVAIGVLEFLAYIGYQHQSGRFGSSLWFALVTYLCLLQFHVLGGLMHRHHRKIGHTPESDILAEASGRDADDDLLQQVRVLSERGDHETAETLLRERLREQHPTPRLYAAYRKLLHLRGDRGALLAQAQSHLVLLLNEDQVRPALGLVRECLDLDPDFMPDQPECAARLADAAADQGMTQMALKLARGYPNTWPRDPRAAHYGLLAARLLAERLQRNAEATVLAEKLLRAYPDHPESADIRRFLQTLHGGDPS